MRIVPLRSRAVALAASSLLTTPFLIAYLTSPADAANPSTTCVATACTYTQSGQSLFQVPTGVSLLRVTAVSAISTSTSKTAASRIAQQVTGNVDVPNGVTELEIIVGEPGSTRAETSAIETSTAGSTEVLLAAAPSAPGAAGHAHRDHQDDLSTRSHAVVPPGGVETPATAPEKVSVSWSLPTDPVTFTSPTTGSLSVGAHTTETITAAGPTAAALAESGSLPPGTIFKDNGNSTAAITGTPLRAGTYPVSITAQAAADSPSVTQWLILTVGETPTITGPSTDTLVVGQAGSFTLTANGTPTPSLAEQGVLPAGVRFEDNGDGTATVSGAPSQAGSYPITVIATSTPGGVATMHLTLETQAADHTSTTTSAPSTATAPSTTTVPSTATSHAATPTATVTSPSAATFLLGAASTFTVTTSGVPAPQISESGALPGGVTFADRGNGTALISGTPAQVGSFPVTITVSGTGANTTQNLDISVDQSPTFTSPTSATMTTGRPTSFTVTSAGTPVARLSENGALPGGVIFKDNGDGTATISGTPTTAGMFSLTITADNNSGTNTTQTLTVTVEQIPAITSAAASTFTYGQTGSFIVTARGTPTPTIGEVGALPNGVTFVDHGDGTATISGTPTQTGIFPLTVTAQNAAGSSEPQTFQLAVDLDPTKTVLTYSATKGATANARLILLATVSSNAKVPPGTVSFYASTKPLGSAPVSTTGVASLSVDIGAGTYVLSATYHPAGGADYLTSTAADVTYALPAIAAASTKPLAFTGAPVEQFTALGGGLVVLGGLVVVIARKRRNR